MAKNAILAIEVMAQVAGTKCFALEGCQLQTPGYLCSFHGWLLPLASHTPLSHSQSFFIIHKA